MNYITNNNSDFVLRTDLNRIASWIKRESSVLDLGCGDGTLLNYLNNNLQTKGVGVELDNRLVIECINKGVRVIQQDLEDGLALFDDKQFDTVILSQTLQSMHHTEHILLEMSRVSNYGIVSFPNFGYWLHGLSILCGRMPVTGQIPYQWYNSPNIHLCTLKDFEELAGSLGLKILERAAFNASQEIKWLINWRTSLALYHFSSS
ncbi:MAG: methionine biosynthesis protein MetW [Bordetella sp.]|nr:MAG: methionine biosynthesis protein MetW [Bordetella sp.]